MSEKHKQFSKNLYSSNYLDFYARALAKEVILINSHKKFKAFDDKNNSNYNINVYLYDSETIDETTKKRIKDLIGEDSFCLFNSKDYCYEIFLSVYSNELLNIILNKNKVFFRGEIIDFSLSEMRMRKEILLSTYRHELAHIKITDLKNESKAFDYIEKNGIPFEIFNILEDVRVNSYWNIDYKNFRNLLNDNYKVNSDLFKNNKTLKDIFFQVCITLDDNKYTYLSPDYPYMKDLFYRVQNAMSSYEVALLSEELYNKIKKNNKLKMDSNVSNSFNPNDPLKDLGKENQEDNNYVNSPESSIFDNSNKEADNSPFDFNDLFSDDFKDISDMSKDSDSNPYEKANPSSFLGKDLVINVSLIEDVVNKIKKQSKLIKDDGQIIHEPLPFIEYNIQEKSIIKNKAFNFLEIEDEQTSLSNIALKKLEKEIANKLKQDYYYVDNPVDDLTHTLNESELYTIPTNPLLEDIFTEDTKNKCNQPPNFVFFCDLSGSMSGIPLQSSKYILATLQNLAKQNILNATIIFHASYKKHNINQIIDVKNVKNYINKIGNLRTYDDEGIIGAVTTAKNSINKKIKEARAIFFLSDCNMAYYELQVKKALADLDNKRIYAIYTGNKYSHNTIMKYFDKGIAVKNKNNAFDIAKEIVLSLVEISNKELNNEDALKNLYKNNNLIVYYNKENTIDNLKRLTKNIKI